MYLCVNLPYIYLYYLYSGLPMHWTFDRFTQLSTHYPNLRAACREETGMGGAPRALRADIAYPQLSQQAEPVSPRSSAQQLSPRTVAASTRALEMERRQLSFLAKHARDLLLIAAGSPAAMRVTARQLDGLRAVVMAAADPRHTVRDAGPAWRLSSLVPSWRNGSSFALSIVDLAAWLAESLPPADTVAPLPSSPELSSPLRLWGQGGHRPPTLGVRSLHDTTHSAEATVETHGRAARIAARAIGGQ